MYVVNDKAVINPGRDALRSLRYPIFSASAGGWQKILGSNNQVPAPLERSLNVAEDHVISFGCERNRNKCLRAHYVPPLEAFEEWYRFATAKTGFYGLSHH